MSIRKLRSLGTSAADAGGRACRGEQAGVRAPAGSFAHIPRAGKFMGFRVESETARYLILTTPRHGEFYRAITLPSRAGGQPLHARVNRRAADQAGEPRVRRGVRRTAARRLTRAALPAAMPPTPAILKITWDSRAHPSCVGTYSHATYGPTQLVGVVTRGRGRCGRAWVQGASRRQTTDTRPQSGSG
jgi:hypothetical protein